MMRTPSTGPIEIASLPVPRGGTVGMTPCPGKCDPRGQGSPGAWQRDLDADLQALVDWGATALLSLVETSEMRLLGVPDLGERAQSLGLEWLHLPIRDMDIPEEAFERTWKQAGRQLHTMLDAGRALVVHCRGGLGRTGTIAARLLIERGMSAEDAVSAVRAARPGAIETPAQRAYVDQVFRHVR